MADLLEQEDVTGNDDVETRIEDDIEEESVEIDEYSISSYGADFDVAGILRRLRRGDIVIPDFQRKYIWSKRQASRFVESLLLGLPVPGIFRYQEEESRKLTVIDGQQRIRTLDDFCQENGESRRPNRLGGLESKFNNSSYHELSDYDRRKLDDSIIHATIIRQEKPENDKSSKYAVFERLNTGGTKLSSQEIRSAIFPGEFGELLTELNANSSWRNLFGKPNKRKRDEELILRFFALFFRVDSYYRPMARFLNQYMQENQHLDCTRLQELQELFARTVDTIDCRIGSDAFRRRNAVNAAVSDSIMVGIARRLEKGIVRRSLKSIHSDLLKNAEYMELVSGSTSDRDNVLNRIRLSTEAFADAE